jgi:hypothetical protein
MTWDFILPVFGAVVDEGDDDDDDDDNADDDGSFIITADMLR